MLESEKEKALILFENYIFDSLMLYGANIGNMRAGWILHRFFLRMFTMSPSEHFDGFFSVGFVALHSVIYWG